MSQKLRLQDLFEGTRYQKIVLTISVLAFLVLELLIYMASASQAGQKSRVIITDTAGKKVYETAGTALTSYEKLVFENNFGSLANYQVNLETEALPFPFRAWVSAAVGIPVGLILLVSFLVRVYLSLLYGEEKEKPDPSSEGAGDLKKNRFGSVLHSFQSFHGISIFHLGFLVVLGVLLLWMVPNFLGDFAKVTITAIREYKWFFLGSSIFLALIITWIIYLRYKLSKQMLENQLHLEKYRVEQQLLMQRETPPLLPSQMNQMNEIQDPR
ncbi:hypothetical protein [Desulforhabdus amnigena]|jgi:hypothetical protein|uniref:Uncharacterized protein n=1 Tax=Desulforhabdus amnigena TaxID=40218 RepID=A0A9W6D398_9BACT|nr:hypothetical protein [Desulforhabdus amnigena]NLJ29680.1 hypothetical protein [Deltaproteobacteria bacterium]GLI33788.1 hypothetical protein DAMNIGENAA_12210 [Desulforhabdus amnigena]